MHPLMQCHYTIAFAASFWLALALLLWQPGLSQQLMVLIIGAGLIGLPHGLTDLLLLQPLGERFGWSSWPFLSGMLIYLLIMAVYLVIWLLFPSFAFALFLCVSIWHFGRQDCQSASPELTWPHAVLRGMLVLLLPYGFWPETTIFFNLIIGRELFVYVPEIRYLAALIALAAIGLALYARARYFLAETALLVGLLVLLPPLLSFTVYFCLWHTPRHYICEYLYYEKAHDYIWHTRKMRGFTALFLLLLVSAVGWAIQTLDKPELMQYFFTIIAILTISHSLITGLARQGST